MRYLNTLLFWFSISLFISVNGYAQFESSSFQILKPPSTAIVAQHKDNLKLTLFIDSIFIGDKKVIPNFNITIPISFESDYIQIKDNLYLKIFIARNQEYGEKFYKWKWDFLFKKDGNFYSQGNSNYEIMDFNGSLDMHGSQGLGVGLENTPEFVMYYYRYKLN